MHFGFVNSNVGFPVVPYSLPVVITLMKLRVRLKIENFMSNGRTVIAQKHCLWKFQFAKIS